MGAQTESIERLYGAPLQSERKGTLFNAFAYPTKISPEAVALYVAAHTGPGQRVYDCFAGSGTAGLAALLCERPPETVRRAADALGLAPQWGARDALLCEIGVLGSFVARVLTNPPDPEAFRTAALGVLDHVDRSHGELYSAIGPDGEPGRIRHVIWTEHVLCAACRTVTATFDSCVKKRPAAIRNSFGCTQCGATVQLSNARRATIDEWDPLLGTKRPVRLRTPAEIHGKSSGRTWVRQANELDHIGNTAAQAMLRPDSVPLVEIPWGDLYRSGYHSGITHLHHLYTHRNLAVFSALWSRVNDFEPEITDALKLWLLGYNGSHSTIMTRVVAKQGQSDLVVTGTQPGVMYVSGLPVEKNLLEGLKRKVAVISEAFRTVHGCVGRVKVVNTTSAKVAEPDSSVDYLFTDPPFGGNIPYAEVNFVNEAWLDTYTDRAGEAIVSKAQNKGIQEYTELLTASFTEAGRLLKPSGKATVVFHSASAAVWGALQNALRDGGLTIEATSVLDKTQGSFKQVTTAGHVKGDAVILLSRTGKPETASKPMKLADLVREALLSGNPKEMEATRIYSRYVARAMESGEVVEFGAGDFYRKLKDQHPEVT